MAERISCEIARDLMPLALDGACSEGSRLAVDAHVDACPPCAQVYDQMKAAGPSPLPYEQTDKEFTKAMKRQGRKMRGWKIAAVICTACLLLTAVFFTIHPEPLLAINSSVPVSWIQAPHLVRTKQDVILLRFTPAEEYRHYLGIQSYTLQPRQGTWEFSYPWLSRVLNREFESAHAPQYTFFENRLIRLSDGDWLVVMPFGREAEWRYQEGNIVSLYFSDLTAEDVLSLTAKGVTVTADSLWVTEETLADTTLSIQGPGGKINFYETGDEIPLCDAETQEKFDQLISSHPYLYHAPETLIPSENSVIEAGKEE